MKLCEDDERGGGEMEAEAGGGDREERHQAALVSLETAAGVLPILCRCGPVNANHCDFTLKTFMEIDYTRIEKR